MNNELFLVSTIEDLFVGMIIEGFTEKTASEAIDKLNDDITMGANFVNREKNIYTVNKEDMEKLQEQYGIRRGFVSYRLT